MNTLTFGATVAALALLGGSVVTYVLMNRQNAVDALILARGEFSHAVDWARYYNREAISYRKDKSYIPAANSLVERGKRMRSARKLSIRVKALEMKVARANAKRVRGVNSASAQSATVV